MIPLENSQVWFSVVCALLFGVGYSFVSCVFSSIGFFINCFRHFPNDVTNKTPIIDLPKWRPVECVWAHWKFSPFITLPVLSIFFMLLSYLTLDGQIRIYMLILVSAGIYLSKFAFFDLLKIILSKKRMNQGLPFVIIFNLS